jgi:hypothetical protein
LVRAVRACRALYFIKRTQGAERPRSAGKRGAAGAFVKGGTELAGERADAVVERVANKKGAGRSSSDSSGVRKKRGGAVVVKKAR